MVILYENHLGDKIIDGNKYLSGNIILKIGDLVLSSLHVCINTGDAKYMI